MHHKNVRAVAEGSEALTAFYASPFYKYKKGVEPLEIRVGRENEPAMHGPDWPKMHGAIRLPLVFFTTVLFSDFNLI